MERSLVHFWGEPSYALQNEPIHEPSEPINVPQRERLRVTFGGRLQSNETNQTTTQKFRPLPQNVK